MKKILFILMAFLAVSCSKQKLADLNKDIKHPATVPGNTLFSNAEKSLSDQDAQINVNLNDFDLWAEYLTETTYVDEANYSITNRAVPQNTWQVYYIDVLQNLHRADSLIKGETTVTAGEKAALTNRLAIIDILECYAWDQMETLWGNIPYSKALNINNTLPAYDDAFTIHKDLIKRVKADITALDVNNGSFGSADLIYNGDVASWKAFANGLLVKMGIQVADYDATVAGNAIQAGMGGAISSPSGNALFQYLGGVPNENPLNNNLVLSGRKDYVAANTIIDAMTSLNDPRLPFYWDQNMGTNTYVGGTYGAPSAYRNYTHINSAIANDGAFPHPLMTYSEIQFYLAEAAARGNLGVPQSDASMYYDNAVKASIEYWGGTSAQADAYLAQSSVAYDQANWKKLIGTQAWISFFTRWYLAWTEWRRLDYPVLAEPAELNSYPSGVKTFPFRYSYPVNEQTLNHDNWEAAWKAQGFSEDDMNQKLYWDKN